MFCCNCGQKLTDDAKFCFNCGAALPVPEAQPAPITEPPVPPTPAAEIPAVAAPVASPVKKKKKKKIWLPILVTVLVLAIVAAVCLPFINIASTFAPLFADKTVYLWTESVTENNGTANTNRREYDEEGRLILVETATEYPQDYGIDGILREIRYKYGEDGLLEHAKLEFASGDSDTTVVDVAYSYKKGILDDVEVDYKQDSDYEYDIRFTDGGQIERVSVTDGSGSDLRYTYAYHKNGKLKTAEMEQIIGSSHTRLRTLTTYNTQGQLVESSTYYDGILRSKVEYKFLENGLFPAEYMIYSYDSEGKLSQKSGFRLEMETEEDKLVSLTIVAEIAPSSGAGQSAKLSGDVEWDGLEASWQPTKVKGDTDQFGDSFDPDDLELEFEMDEHGNLIRYDLSYQGKSVFSGETEYIAITVPRSYNIPSTVDPLFSLNWIAG